MSRWHRLVAILGTLLCVPGLVDADADGPTAKWLQPSGKWYGADGNWSSMGLSVGEPVQQIDVIVSTSLSEIWVIENGGCETSLCDGARGGVFNRSASKSWLPMGLWPLGLRGILHTNGDYGVDTVAVYDNVERSEASFGTLLIAGINDTAAYTGLFGLGITKGSAGIIAQGPIASMVEQRGLIPSHSYGYTAGAYYADANGIPMSLTLGGYDANRFEPHDVQFDLNAVTRQPQVQVRSITATTSNITQAPTEWSSPSTPLLLLNESLTATIDSSTPYLWLPPTVCDRFASVLNLTWNETFELYFFSSTDDLERYRSAPNLSFTFALSSADKDGSPLSTSMSDVVNITVSANAFIQSLRYPFNNTEFGAPAVPYFPLKRAESRRHLTIGRSFLQEAYIITNYETNMFSVHEARFPSDPWTNVSIQTIAASPNSPYPGPPKNKRPQTLTPDQIAGVVIGACLGSIALIIAGVVFARRSSGVSKTDENVDGIEEYMRKFSSSEPDSATKPTPAAWLRIISRVKNNHSKSRGNQDRIDAPGIDTNQDRGPYEMPGSLPAELDATDITTGTFSMATTKDDAFGQGMHSRPPQWAVSPKTSGPDGFLESAIATRTPQPINTHSCDYPSPLSSPAQDYDPNGVPSPITPESDDPSFVGGYHSNPTLVCIPPSPVDADHSTVSSRCMSSVTPDSCQSPISIPSPLIQRTPIASTHVVCLGPLPQNIQLPHQLMMQRPRSAQGLDVALGSGNPSRPHSIADTLGSNYTLEEEARIAATGSDSTASSRIDGSDIVHVPQRTHPRYSWESVSKEAR
ncbi:aspartic peptidase domain-containing protein [Xylaria sp. CBS 124048]|nr:aspartic peptidase domain-containing protein [Xylaria sp. CBS 124048]